MKICQWVLVVLFLQGRACGIIEYVDDAYDTVKDKFRIFLGEVRADVALAVDCTIFAVEQLILSDDDEYRQRCLQQSSTSDSEYVADSGCVQDDTPLTSEPDTKNYDANANHNLIDTLVHKNIDATAFQLNNKLTDGINDNDIYSKLEIIRTSFTKESQHLQDVDTYLRHKINSLDMNVNIEKPTIAPNISPFEDIWSNLNVLHKTKNPIITRDAEVIEIDNVVNSIMEIVPTNGTDAAKSAKIDTMIDNLAQNINVIKNTVEKPAEEAKNEIAPVHVPLHLVETLIKRRAVDSNQNETPLDKSHQTETKKEISFDNHPISVEELVKPHGIDNNLNTPSNSVEMKSLSEGNKKDSITIPLNAVEELIKPQTTDGTQYTDKLNEPANTVEELLNSHAIDSSNEGIFSNSQPSAVEELIQPHILDSNKFRDLNTPANPVDNVMNTPSVDLIRPMAIESKNAVENLIKPQSTELNAPLNSMPKSADVKNEVFNDNNNLPSSSVDLIKPQADENKKYIFSSINTPMNAVEDLVKPQAVDNNNDIFSNYFDDFTGISDISGNSAAPVARSAEARNIIKQHQMSESIINKYFDNPKYVVDDFSNNHNYGDDYNDDLFDNFQ